MVRCRFQIILFALVLGCSPAEPGIDGPGDATIDGPQLDDAGNLIRLTQVTLHVAGLLGRGLTLKIDGSQTLAVPGDGIWKVPLTLTTEDVDVAVLTQPSEPDQSCEVLKLAIDVFTVSCHEQRWVVSGTLGGLSGKGLRLALIEEGGDEEDGDVYELLSPAIDGAITFTTPLPDKVNFEVKVVAQPTSPRQTCTVANGIGFADQTPIDKVAINCVTTTYGFTSVVTGLVGKGLTVKTAGFEYPVFAGTTQTSEYRVPDGYRYSITIGKQPTDPSQVCYIEDGVGIVDGADFVYNIICDALGNLGISEVGSCPFDTSSCWFEVYNFGTLAEEFAFYKMRSSARSPTGAISSRVFALPALQIPASGSVAIQGKTAGSMADGQGVIHVANDDVVPWWGKDGFVELLNPSGATVSFVRFGANIVEPTTGGFWSGPGAPALPVGTGGYGYSIQHVPRAGTYSKADWSLEEFATYGAFNDSFQHIDADADGIPDAAEVAGGTFGTLDLYAMGARVGARDVFIEVDHMGGTDPASIPRKEALEKVVDAFMRHNIVLHFDVGNLFASGFDPANFNLGGGDEVPFAAGVAFAPTDPGIKNVYDYKAAYMEARRRMVFHYMLFGWSQQRDGSVGSSGVGELPGNDSLITLGGLGLAAGDATQRNTLINYQAVGMMHELGHNFGLRHGGDDQLPRKPNYLSVMNYLYSPQGLPTLGTAEGDRYEFYKRCRVSSLGQLTNPPTGDTSKFLIDYSSGTGSNLVESMISEAAGLGRGGSKAVDFNCSGQTDGPYAIDLNSDGTFDTLRDYNDWAALDLIFRRTKDGAENGPSLLYTRSIERDDVFTADTAHRTGEPCP